MSRRNRNKVEVLNEAEVDLNEPIDGIETPEETPMQTEEPKKRKVNLKKIAAIGAGAAAALSLIAGMVIKSKNDRDAFMAAAMLGESTEDETEGESDEETEEDEDETEGEED